MGVATGYLKVPTYMRVSFPTDGLANYRRSAGHVRLLPTSSQLSRHNVHDQGRKKKQNYFLELRTCTAGAPGSRIHGTGTQLAVGRRALGERERRSRQRGEGVRRWWGVVVLV